MRTVETAQAQVEIFHRRFGHPIGEEPALIPLDRAELRYDLINEELWEMYQAQQAGDLVEIADALGDLLYVVYGTAVEYGIDMAPVVSEIHRSNMQKTWPDGSVRTREDGKILKPAGWTPPDLGAVLRGQGWNG